MDKGSTKLFYSQPFGKKSFRGTSVKDAYLKACKWYASNVIAKDTLHNVQVEFVKDSAKNKVTIILYAVLPEHEALEEHCQCCREMHHSFFINQENDCNRCSALGYQKRLDRHLSNKIGYYKELLNKILKEKGELSDEQEETDELGDI